jgi:hypothetical protein
MKNNILYIILGGSVLYYFYNKNKTQKAAAAAATAAATPPVIVAIPKIKKPQPKVILPPTPKAPNFPLLSKLNLKLPIFTEKVYDNPNGKILGAAKTAEYIGYSPIYKDWIKLKIVVPVGIYNIPTIKEVWSKSTNWKIAQFTV